MVVLQCKIIGCNTASHIAKAGTGIFKMAPLSATCIVTFSQLRGACKKNLKSKLQLSYFNGYWDLKLPRWCLSRWVFRLELWSLVALVAFVYLLSHSPDPVYDSQSKAIKHTGFNICTTAVWETQVQAFGEPCIYICVCDPE